MDNHKVILEKFTRYGQPTSISRIFSKFEHREDTVFYEDFIEKTIEFLKNCYREETEETFDFESHAHDLLLAIGFLRGHSVKVSELSTFLDKQYDNSYYYSQKEDYKRYTKSVEKE